ncbi:MAG: two-component regulator propeller domain-containing protein, partial [Terracidiphilus sp.]
MKPALRNRAALVLLCAGTLLQAQQFVFHAYRQAEGLKNLAIHTMACDREGYLWVATENGLYRFLGSGFIRYGPEQGLGGIDIRDVRTDAAGIVWAGTDRGLYRWEGQRFVPATPAPVRIFSPWLIAPEDGRNLLVIDSGRLWRLEHDPAGKVISFRAVLSERELILNPELGQLDSVNVVADAAGGYRIWAGSGKKLYSWPDRGGAVPQQGYEGPVASWGVAEGLAGDLWRSVSLDRQGGIWAAGEHHVAWLGKDARRFTDRTMPGSSDQGGGILNHGPLLEDAQGRMLGAAAGGIARWESGHWRIVGEAEGLERSGVVVGMAFDTVGDLWIASSEDALYHWVGYADWEGWGLKQGLPSAVVWDIVPRTTPSGPQVLIGTVKGPAVIDPRGGPARGLFPGEHWRLGETDILQPNRDGTLFAATRDGGLLRIDPAHGRAERTGTLPVHFYSS